MFKARYYKTDGKKGKARALPDSLFDGVVNDAVLHQVVKAYLANQRQGTHAAKSRGQVAGGSRKPWRQKGTGRARQGTIRAVQWTGGGRAFPPIPHSWNQKIPRKVKALARRSAFNARAGEDRVVLVDALAMDAPKTAALRDYLASIELGGSKVLVLTDGLSETVHLSARNMPHVEVRAFGTESVYDILWADAVVIERSALDALESAPAAKKAEAAAPAAEAAPAVEEVVDEEAPAEETPVAEAEEAEVEGAAADEAEDASDEEAKDA
jgi:large subunit ribosomal protein L4